MDTTAPTVTVSATPAASGGSYSIDALPTAITAQYADPESGVDPATLNVTFTLNGSTMDITELFARDAVMNRTSTQTTGSDPLSRVPVDRYTSTAFTGGAGIGSFPRSGAGAVYVTPDATAGRIYVWSPSVAQVSVYNASLSAGAGVGTIPLAFTPAAVAPAGGLGKIYLANPTESAVYVYDGTALTFLKKVATPDVAKGLVFNPLATGRLYVVYSSRAKVGVADTGTDALQPEWDTGFVPALWTAMPTAAGQVAFVATTTTSLGAYRFLRYDSGGTKTLDVGLGQDLPKDVEWTGTSDVYFSIFASASVTWLATGTGVTNRVTVGSAPTDMFSDSTNLMVVNTGDSTISIVDGTTHGETARVTVTPRPLGGAAIKIGGTPVYYLVRDVWDFAGQTTGTITVKVKNKAGIEGQASMSLTFHRSAPGTP